MKRGACLAFVYRGVFTRSWMWVCRTDSDNCHCSRPTGGYASAGEAADAARGHLRHAHAGLLLHRQGRIVT